MSHILDYEVPVDYTPLDALARIFTDHKQDMRKTDVYKGKITTPRDVTHAIGVAITEATEESIHEILNGLPMRVGFVYNDMSQRQNEDYNSVTTDPFDAYSIDGFLVILARDIAHLSGAINDLMLLKGRAWNALIWGAWTKVKKAWHVINNPKLLVGVAYAAWLEFKKIQRFILFRNPGANLICSWLMVIVNIKRVWIVEASALYHSILDYLNMADKNRQMILGFRINVPGMDDKQQDGMLARKIKARIAAVKRMLRRAWHEVSSYSLGRFLQDVFGTGSKVTRSATYEGLYKNMRSKRYRLWQDSTRYPNAYKHGGSYKQETYRRPTMASLNGRIAYP
jgi:hypothetical protein